MEPNALFPRYLHRVSLSGFKEAETAQLLIIGGGIAGLMAGITAASHSLDVHLIAKAPFNMTNTYWAQGGIAVSTGPDDVPFHIEDTMKTGNGLSEMGTVKHIVQRGVELLEKLQAYGCHFDHEDGKVLLTREGGHSAARILHARGDATGSEIEDSLFMQAGKTKGVTLHENTFVQDILTNEEGVCGVVLLEKGRLRILKCKSVILASGGACQIYRESTNPEGATGDGIAMAYRAGAVLSDLEFVQFHPTVFYLAGAPRSLITESVRGEGAKLVDRNRHRFMPDYHPAAELAPRDVVSRAIRDELIKNKETNAYLDLSSFDKEKVAKRFPKIYKLCLDYELDPICDLIPIRPAAHYFVGGVWTNLEGKTSLPGLFACGEAASVGLHGANRLGSNSLLEGLVMGYTSGNAAAAFLEKSSNTLSYFTQAPALKSPIHFDIQDLRNSVKSLMWTRVGLARDGKGLEFALNQIEGWNKMVQRHETPLGDGEVFKQHLELKNLLMISSLVASGALRRKESRGVHFRLDYTKTDDIPRHSFFNRETGFLEETPLVNW